MSYDEEQRLSRDQSKRIAAFWVGIILIIIGVATYQPAFIIGLIFAIGALHSAINSWSGWVDSCENNVEHRLEKQREYYDDLMTRQHDELTD